MIKRGDKFMHRQIKGVIYEVETVDASKDIVYLKDGYGSRLVKVSFQDLQAKYNKA